MKAANLIRLFVIVMVLAAGGMTAVQAADVADIAGNWELEVVTSNGAGYPILDLKQDGQKISGTYAGQLGNSDVSGKIKGNDFKVSFEINGQYVVCSGKVDGNQMSGTVDMGSNGSGTFTGEKK